MARLAPPALGLEAPSFDLSSTEGVVLALRDEVIRTAIVLYFFAASGERELRDLAALNARIEALRRRTVRVLALSPLPLETLKTLQRQHEINFPLLHDDRGFSAAYGIGAEAEGSPSAPALAVVDRQRTLRFLASPLDSIEAALPRAEAALKALPSPTSDYPRSVINRWIDAWVQR